MKKHQQGFTYPLILCLLLVFLVFFSIQIEQLLSERKMAQETTTLMLQEYYFLSTIKKVEQLFQVQGSIPTGGSYLYANGTINYQADAPAGTLQKVNFSLVLTGQDPIIGTSYFDTRSKKMIKWVELN